MHKIFVDTDVCLDLFLNRKPFHEDAEQLFVLADFKSVKLYVSSLSIANLHYILKSNLSSRESRDILLKFKTLVQILAVDEECIELALASNFNDFEDAIQNACAMQHHIPIIVTRNLKDYKKSSLKILSPTIFLSTINKDTDHKK